MRAELINRTHKIMRLQGLAILAAALLVFSGCQSSPDSSNSTDLEEIELKQIIEIFTGRFQGEAINPAAKKDPESPPTMRIFHDISMIDAPQFGQTVLYHRFSRDSIDGPVMQQKIYVFDTEPQRPNNRMQAYYVLAGIDGTQIDVNTATIKHLDPSTLMTFPPECIIKWAKEKDTFTARVKKQDCSYPSKAFKQVVSPDMTYTLDRDSFELFEAMYTQGGDTIFAMDQAISAKRISE